MFVAARNTLGPEPPAANATTRSGRTRQDDDTDWAIAWRVHSRPTLRQPRALSVADGLHGWRRGRADGQPLKTLYRVRARTAFDGRAGGARRWRLRRRREAPPWPRAVAGSAVWRRVATPQLSGTEETRSAAPSTLAIIIRTRARDFRRRQPPPVGGTSYPLYRRTRFFFFLYPRYNIIIVLISDTESICCVVVPPTRRQKVIAFIIIPWSFSFFFLRVFHTSLS